MKYLSVCSGIEAATVAWHPLGWEPLAFSEIEPFPRKVLAHHYPDVPLHGDFTILKDQPWIKDADLLVGGTPCQAFSVAGLRQSLADDRGNLTLEFVRLANAIDDLRRAGDGCTIVWENVPGVLSVKDNAFGCFLGALVGNDTPLIPTGGKWTNAGMVIGPQRSAAWRILDAQYFGVAQRRRRVFVVASARDGFDPAEVLFEREGLRRDTAPRREERKDVAGPITAGISKGMRGTEGIESNWAVPVAIGLDQEYNATIDGYGTLKAKADSGGFEGSVMQPGMAVRRLTPRECERLQGFPDDYTAIPGGADGPRYKSLGNSMAVPVMRWIGQRIKNHLELR
jgi:site-specific DNA-cytosine methylase